MINKRHPNKHLLPKSRDEVAMINAAFYGADEPALHKDLGVQLNWYTACSDTKAGREWLYDFLEDSPEEVELLKKVPDAWFPSTAAWLARLHARGFPLTHHNYDYLNKLLATAYTHAVVEVPDNKLVYVPTIQERIREKASNLIGELEGMIDDGVINPGCWSLYDYLRKNQVSNVVANRLIEYLKPIAGELIEVSGTPSKQLKEGYEPYSSQEIEDMAIIYQSMLDDAIHYTTNIKKSQVPRRRRKKVPNVEKILKHFKYLKNLEEYKLVSIDPSKIIGAHEMWAYNTKNKMLTVYRAQDETGLGVNKTAIAKYDENASMAKKIGRTTKKTLQEVMKSNKVTLRRLLDAIKGKRHKVSRFTENTLIVRIP